MAGDWSLLFGDALLGLCCLSLVVAVVGYRRGYDRLGREGAIVGFGLLAVVFGIFTISYATSNRTDRLFLVTVTALGAGLSVHAIGLVVRDWGRRRQLTTMAAGVLVLALPFEFAPGLRLLIQEELARQLVTIASTLGYQPDLVSTAGGHMARLSFENGGYYQISRECTGIDGIALFGGILLGVKTTWRRRLAGFAFMLTAVYVVNMLRMVFVVAAISGDWFGPLLTNGDTIQMTYYVAEVAIGQSVVVAASVLGYLWVSRWIPDGLDFATALLDTLDRAGE
jgi:archaeosortase A (PGF-CTERM-specific)